ncbi:hypothetical protein [Calothrix sp. UHCC 0171]|uniref:hypothetical protein n=1 Tax=Calothrix sp. UHCC 0171 TaxID=3110245 RepID=UPI002B221572|nr:hypothetical protein [Calothrix sp. UHCC 0171]MEA5570602.1 hypothetical protein [Calothrix sp. UHCC 0171]
MQLIEIPTASKDIIAQLAESDKKELPPEEKPQPTITEYQTAFLQITEVALRDIQLPSPAQLLRYEVIITNSILEPLGLNMVYLSEREISADAKKLLVDDIRNRLSFPRANVRFQRISVDQGIIKFAPDSPELQSGSTQLLDRIGRIIQLQPNLQLEITADLSNQYPNSVVKKRVEVIKQYLNKQAKIATNQINISPGKTASSRNITLKMKALKL